MTGFYRLAVGDELPPLKKGPVTRQMLVEWCAAENDYYALHYDERVADLMKLPGTPIQGTFKYALMGQMMQQWLGGRGQLQRITASYRGVNLEGETIIARGRVASIELTATGRRLLVDIWIENQQGERSTTGQATALLSA